MNLYKKRIILNLSLLIIIGIIPIITVKAPDDSSTGSFLIPDVSDSTLGQWSGDIINDAPSFISWLNQTALVSVNIDVLFYTTVTDIDNTSAEVATTLYYSNDSFVLDNQSAVLVFSQESPLDYFYSTYNFAGQSEYSYFEYYYSTYDGETRIREPSLGVYFDIQWGSPPQVGPGGGVWDETTTIPEGVDIDVVTKLGLSSFAFNLFLLLVILLVIGYFKRNAIRERLYPAKEWYRINLSTSGAYKTTGKSRGVGLLGKGKGKSKGFMFLKKEEKKKKGFDFL